MTNFIAISFMNPELFKNVAKILDQARCVTTVVATRIEKCETDIFLIHQCRATHIATCIMKHRSRCMYHD